MPQASERYPLHCTCCGMEVLAERVGDVLVIRGKRHGREHILMIPLNIKGDSALTDAGEPDGTASGS